MDNQTKKHTDKKTYRLKRVRAKVILGVLVSLLYKL